MRVLFAHKSLGSGGGVDTVLRRTIDGLRSRGHEVALFAPESRAVDDWPEVQCYLVPDVEGQSLRAQVVRATTSAGVRRPLTRAIDDFRPDVVHAFSIYHQLGTALLGVAASRAPLVVSAHDYKVGCATYQTYDYRRAEACSWCLDASAVRAATAPLIRRCSGRSLAYDAALSLEALSSRLRRDYRRNVSAFTVLNDRAHRVVKGAGIAEARIHHLPNPSLATKRPPPPSLAGARAIFVGRLAHEKGVDLAIRATDRLGIPLTVVGDGPERAVLAGLAASLNAKVEFTGWLDEPGCLARMAEASVLLCPSRYPEGQSTVATDALMLGLPVVGSDVAGIGDLIRAYGGVEVAAGSLEEFVGGIRRSLRGDGLKAPLKDLASSFGLDAFLTALVGIYTTAMRSPVRVIR